MGNCLRGKRTRGRTSGKILWFASIRRIYVGNENMVDLNLTSWDKRTCERYIHLDICKWKGKERKKNKKMIRKKIQEGFFPLNIIAYLSVRPNYSANVLCVMCDHRGLCTVVARSVHEQRPKPGEEEEAWDGPVGEGPESHQYGNQKCPRPLRFLLLVRPGNLPQSEEPHLGGQPELDLEKDLEY